jgi:hypothetical protein
VPDPALAGVDFGPLVARVLGEFLRRVLLHLQARIARQRVAALGELARVLNGSTERFT